MPISITELPENVVEVRLSGKLHKDDYDEYVPRIESIIEQSGKVRFLMIMEDFHGWDLGAVWEDTKFDVQHHDDIERLAMVGDKKWEQWMAKICNPFTGADIKYFDQSELDAARGWVVADESAG